MAKKTFVVTDKRVAQFRAQSPAGKPMGDRRIYFDFMDWLKREGLINSYAECIADAIANSPGFKRWRETERESE